MYHIYFYVPETHLDIVKQAMFEAGAGHIGNYDCCSWQTIGEGQYRPLTGSNPHIGKPNQYETTTEYKVEMICEAAYLRDVITAFKKAHPYEEPAYGIISLTV